MHSQMKTSPHIEFDNLHSGETHRWRLKSWPVVAIALATLLILLVFSILAARRKSQDVYTQLDEVNMLHRHVEAKLRRLRSDFHLSGIFIRDYLLDNSHITGPYYRDRLTELRDATTATIAELDRSLAQRQSERVESLRSKLEDYWQAFDPLFDWTPAEKSNFSAGFLRQHVLPRRDAVLVIAQDIEEFNNANAQEQRAEVAVQERELHNYLNRMLLLSLLFGAAVSVVAVVRIRVLERRSEDQRDRAERTEGQMRELSHQLVRAQEEERRSLSRELHDEVGQTLTALRMELGTAEKAETRQDGTLNAHLQECKHLVESLIQSVRDLSMGLRPAMLDDLGLGPALGWQARDFSRRYNVPVNMSLDGALDSIGEPHRTVIYRVIQEALTNCARHANASQISVTARNSGELLRVLVHDDGIGLDKNEQSQPGLGLLGIKERVRELGGRMSLYSTENTGTTLEIEFTLENTLEAPLADRAGG
jgi:signal transduction histidine kinase